MIELHLIGYTEDAEHLVLDLEVEGEGRYTVRIDPDLLATVAQLREVRVARGAPVDRRPDPEPAPTNTNGQHPALPPEAEDAVEEALEDAVEEADPASLPAPLPPPRPRRARVPAPRVRRTPEPEEPPAPATEEPPTPERDEHRPAALAVPHAKLSPAEIQTQLRAGRSVRAVAAEAGTDLAWIERWLPPILAERERVLDEARRRRLDVPRARPLGSSVARALADRGVPADRTTWSATRRADGRWRVSVRFEDRGRPRNATWLMDPGGERVQAASPLAEELAGPGGGPARRR
ncbi:septation protein SepH [Nitriliruptor alkaliphilus]|uniref:septation protein SepH n=1 Tax=Nitriliruptor alkaliphilus TaxID=427918 RepID=UPI000697ACA9|nr:septation protein SepH [Nitriliruptor alkaliphilus]